MESPRGPGWHLVVPVKGGLGREVAAAPLPRRRRPRRRHRPRHPRRRRAVVGPARVVVVTSDPAETAYAARRASPSWRDPGSGLDAACTAGVARGAGRAGRARSRCCSATTPASPGRAERRRCAAGCTHDTFFVARRRGHRHRPAGVQPDDRAGAGLRARQRRPAPRPRPPPARPRPARPASRRRRRGVAAARRWRTSRSGRAPCAALGR